jgi:hypothetical protein
LGETFPPHSSHVARQRSTCSATCLEVAILVAGTISGAALILTFSFYHLGPRTRRRFATFSFEKRKALLRHYALLEAKVSHTSKQLMKQVSKRNTDPWTLIRRLMLPTAGQSPSLAIR